MSAFLITMIVLHIIDAAVKATQIDKPREPTGGGMTLFVVLVDAGFVWWAFSLLMGAK